MSFNFPNVCRVAGIAHKPVVTLRNWQIKETVEGKFFAGEDNGAGRVSTVIVDFDEKTKSGRTLSGRVYELVGDSGSSSQVEYLWGCYKQINRLTDLPVQTSITG